ncbi:MAG: hypothetical protein DRQ02_11735 [Candidatus Latescibacterota bacterium]|nr:MAG: hypothetical protein DRQ02_11735 [Candidatus Latescibacterota bacterium]RKY71055.1 MAG: hypothetical protein DRQ24_08180 [Candidatus Latescibacterota bacterium]
MGSSGTKISKGKLRQQNQIIGRWDKAWRLHPHADVGQERWGGADRLLKGALIDYGDSRLIWGAIVTVRNFSAKLFLWGSICGTI